MVEENESLPAENLLEFKHSFGYDSQKLHNLCVYNDNLLIWGAGSIIVFYDTKGKNATFKKSFTTGNIGSIIKCPNSDNIAVGENFSYNSFSSITIYNWPTLSIVQKLEENSNATYTCLNFSKDGLLLASLSGEPENKLTIWDIQTNRIKLQAKPFSCPIYNVIFSSYNNDQLITCGKNHIKFWYLGKTFTGLKLIQEHGYFGKKNISDIYAILSMPDGKVLSGCSWGNILVWESSSIKFEISRKGRKACHDGPIMQFVHNEETNEIKTVGLDGRVCFWPWNTIIHSEPYNTDEEPFIEINPLADKYFAGSQFMSIFQQKDPLWYAQDACNGISLINLKNVQKNALAFVNPFFFKHRLQKIAHGHGCDIIGFALLRNIPYFASLGSDGSFLVHKLPSGPTVTLKQFKDRGTCLFYMPAELDETGKTIIFGFENGTIKLIMLLIENAKPIKYKCFQILKPHKKSVNIISHNKHHNFILTGSDDSTIFIYLVDDKNLIPFLTPLYFIETPNRVTCACWNSELTNTILLSGFGGFVLEGSLPIVNEPPDTNRMGSYKMDFVNSKVIFLKQYTLYPKVQNDDIIYDKKDYFVVDENDFELVCENNFNTHISVTNIIYDSNDNSKIWIAQESCNCFINVKLENSEIIAFIPMKGSTRNFITTLINIENNVFILGMNNGEIRICSLPNEYIENSIDNKPSTVKIREKKLRNITNNKKLEIVAAHQLISTTEVIYSMHSKYISKISLSFDKETLYTAGGDGNIFSLKFYYQLENKMEIPEHETVDNVQIWESLPEEKKSVTLSHEEYLQTIKNTISELNTSNKKRYIERQFEEIKDELQKIYERNIKMPLLVQIKFEEESRVQAHIENELDKRLQSIKQRLASSLDVSTLKLRKMMERNVEPLDLFPFHVFSLINANMHVNTIRQKRLPLNFDQEFEDLCRKYTKSRKISRKLEEDLEDDETILTERLDENVSAPLLEDFPENLKFPRTLNKAINLYIERHESQKLLESQSRNQHLKYSLECSQETKTSCEIATDVYYLKTQVDKISQPTIKYDGMIKMFKIKKEIYEIVQHFNESLKKIRQDKLDLLKKYSNDMKRLNEIKTILPSKFIKPPPYDVFDLDYEKEFPEKNLEIKLEETSNNNDGLGLAETDQKKNEAEHSSNIKQNIELTIEQNEIIFKMKNYIDNWEESLKNCFTMREEVMLRAQFLKLHLLFLMKQQLILDSFESLESSKSAAVMEIQIEIQKKNEELQSLQKYVETKKGKIQNLVKENKKLFQRFKLITSNNRFEDFFKMVFKDSQLSSESRSSTPESDNEKKELVGDFMDNFSNKLVNLDINSCPPGCDPQIYEEVILLKSNRYEIGLKIEDEKNKNDSILKEIEYKTAIINTLLTSLKIKQGELKNVMNKKQRDLNEIECIIVLRPHQCMANVLENVETSKGILVFPKDIIDNLKGRVNDLKNETVEQQNKYKISKEHLKRMKADCDYMNSKISDYQQQIQTIITQKLGLMSKRLKKNNNEIIKNEATKILDDVLHAMMHQFKLKISTGLSAEMENQLFQWKKKRFHLEQQYCSSLQEHTKKLETATMLQAEILSYTKNKNPKTMSATQKELGYQKDINRLRNIRYNNERQIEELRNEIQRLKLKPFTTPIIPHDSPTNTSSPSIVMSPVPSDVLYATTKSLATTLVNELTNSSIPLVKNFNENDILVKKLSETLPLLFQGKLDAFEAASRIIDLCADTKTQATKHDSLKKLHESISDILSRINNENIKLSSEISIIIDNPKSLTSFELKCIIKELLDAEIPPEDQNAINSAVTTFLEAEPQIKTHLLDIESITNAILDENVYELNVIQSMVNAFMNSLKIKTDISVATMDDLDNILPVEAHEDFNEISQNENE